MLLLLLVLQLGTVLSWHHSRVYARIRPLYSNDQFFNPADDELFNIFWKQLESSPGGTLVKDNSPREYTTRGRAIRLPQKRLVENYIKLVPGVPLELLYNKRLVFGNYVQTNENKGSIKVALVSGATVDVSIGQIISSWDILADEVPPITPTDWAQVATEAIQLLGDMSPRKSDLQEFHQILSTQRSTTIPVDSLDLGIYIFQERRFKAWVNPYLDADSTGVFALSAAQRYAAALLLHHDDFRFKRRQSMLVDTSTLDSGAGTIDLDQFMEDETEVVEEASYLVEGGYKILDEGTVSFREGDAFMTFYEGRLKATGEDRGEASPFRAACVSKQLRAIEVSHSS